MNVSGNHATLYSASGATAIPGVPRSFLSELLRPHRRGCRPVGIFLFSLLVGWLVVVLLLLPPLLRLPLL